MKATVKKFKFFSAHEDEVQEAWLQDMAKQGLHFAGFDQVGRYTFVKGEPAPMAYRIDYTDQWKTGDEPMTAAQRSYLNTLASEAGEDVEEDLTKADASKRIDELQERTGRGKER